MKHMKGIKQKLLLAADILLIVASVGLVALNMFVCKFPEWVVLIAAALLAAVNVIYFVKFKTRLAAKILLSLLSVLAVCFSLFGSYCNPYWNSTLFRNYGATADYDEILTYKQAKADLDYAMHYLKKCHPLFLGGTPEEVQSQYKATVDNLKNTDKITVNTLRRETQKIFSVLSDGHTSVRGSWEERYLKTIDLRNNGGWRLAAINGQSLERIFSDNKELFSYEVESWGMQLLKSNVSTLSGLDFLGIEADGVEYTWQNADGEQETESYTAADFLTYDEYIEYNKAYITDTSDEDFVSYSIDESKSLALLTLKSCNYNRKYIDCVKDMFTEVKQKNIKNVAVDIRGNGGGSSMVANEFIRYLNVEQYKDIKNKWRFGIFNIPFEDNGINQKYANLTFDGNVFLLTDTDSFSSSMLFAQYVKDNNLGTIIGEPPGNTPNGYGDISIFQMPNSGLYFHVSTKEFFRIDSECTDILVMPDIQCESGEALNVLYNNLEQ